MNPEKLIVEDVLAKHDSNNIAMSILASGAVPPEEAVKYISSLKGVDSVLFGASSKANILNTKNLLDQFFCGK